MFIGQPLTKTEQSAWDIAHTEWEALPVDYKILRYEFHYVRRAIQILRESKLDDVQRSLESLEESFTKLATTTQRLIDEKLL